jgi:hypothetical protein
LVEVLAYLRRRNSKNHSFRTVWIGFHFPTGSAPAEGTLRPRRHDGGLVVRAQGFFTAHGIAPTKYAGRYQPKAVKDRALKTLFVISLRRTARRKKG